MSLTKINLSKLFVFLSIFMINLAFAVDYPQTIWIPVTFYDFHSDRSNPEFEQRHMGQLRTGMVSSDLGSDGKPVLGNNPYMNYYLKYWFRPWESSAKGDFTIPDYEPHASFKQGDYVRDNTLGVEGWQKEYQQNVTYNGNIKVDYDTAFINKVIQDSLPFTHIGNGVYEYRNAKFFPLDNRGFGNEWNYEVGKNDPSLDIHHNYSFTMELHFSFVKVPGLTFDFSGDDDVWVFLNKKLQIDLGGIHEEQQQSFNVDNVSGLQNGKSYDLDVFYAERHSAESHIRITSNILFAPSNLRLYRYPGTPDVGANQALGRSDSIALGQPFTYYGHIFDSAGVWQPQYDSLITWELVNTNGNPGLANNKGASVTVTATVPNSSMTLIGHFKDPNNPARPESQIQITLYTKKGSLPVPYTLKLYAKSGTPDVSGNASVTNNTISVVAGQPVTIYGHLFDSTGIWKSDLDQYIKWRILENEPGATLDQTSGDRTSVTVKKAEVNITLVAVFTDPNNLARPSSEARVMINAEPNSAKKLEIIQNPVPKNMSGDDNFTELVFGKGDQKFTVYAILRDEFGNYIKVADNAFWRSSDQFVVQVSPVNGKSTDITKQSKSEGEECYITATQDDLSDSLKVVISTVTGIAISPNPFIPGVTNLKNKAVLPLAVQTTYSNILNSVPNPLGTLIAVGVPYAFDKINTSGTANPYTSYARIVIYDALGNVVRSDLGLYMASNSRLYGTIWDGRNENKRYVGAGTYLADIFASYTHDGKSYVYHDRKKIAVTKTGD